MNLDLATISCRTGKKTFSFGAAVGIVLALFIAVFARAHAQGVRRELELVPSRVQPENSIGIDAELLGVGVSYARVVGTSLAVGLGAGAGGDVGIMLFADEFSTGSYGPDHTFAELLHGDLFLRTSAGDAWQIEIGARVSWLYHLPTEYETIFVGLQAAPLVKLGSFRLGPRLFVGRMTERAGRSETNLGLIPVLIRYEWRW